MTIRYFEDTDTMLIEFSSTPVCETREISEDVYVDFDSSGGVVGITIEHTSAHGDISELVFQRLPSRTANQSLEPTR